MCGNEKEKVRMAAEVKQTTGNEAGSSPKDGESERIMSALLGSKEKELKKQVLGNYTPQKRAMDIIDTCLFGILFVFAFYNLAVNVRMSNLWLSALAFVLSMLFSDFCSGLLHWGADTWGTFDTPFVGPTFIRSFREHHVTPTAMCKHDVFETNGDNCLATLPVLILMILKDTRDADANVLNWPFFVLNFWVWTCLWVALTNQFHSWSHMQNPPLLAVILQKTGLILSPNTHRKHHQMPFDRNYCITNGWLEPVLTYFDFWRRAEVLIEKYTGMIPREDDKKWTGISDQQPDAILNLQQKNQ